MRMKKSTMICTENIYNNKQKMEIELGKNNQCKKLCRVYGDKMLVYYNQKSIFKIWNKYLTMEWICRKLYFLSSFLIFLSFLFLVYNKEHLYNVTRFVVMLISFLIYYIIILLKPNTVILRLFGKKNPFIIKIYLLSFAILLIISLLLRIVGVYPSFTSYLYSFSVSFLLIFTSYLVSLNKIETNLLVTVFLISSFVIAAFAILKYNPSFSILPYYFLEEKNQIGTILVLSIILILNIYRNTNNLLAKIFTLCDFLFGFFMLLVLRVRNSIIASIITSAAVFISIILKSKKRKNFFIFLSLIIILFILLWSTGILGFIVSKIEYSLFAGKDIKDLDLITGHRYSRVLNGIEHFKEAPFLGYGSVDYSRVHFSFLGYIFDIGSIGSFPLLLVYFLIPIYFILKAKSINGIHIKLFHISFLLLI